MPRKLAPGALLSNQLKRTRSFEKYHRGPDNIPSMEHLTPEQIEKIDPGGAHARSLMRKSLRKESYA